MTSPQHAPQPILVRPRVERFAILLLILVVIAVAIASIAFIRAGNAERDARHQRAAKVGVAQALGTANSSLTRNGLQPVATPTAAGPLPTVTITLSGKPGPPGPGPSSSQIELALASYCGPALTRCKGSPTAAQVAQAIASYCGPDGKCRGPAGPSGPAGNNGQSATADQVAAGLATYCGAHNQCAGPAGPAGPSGSNGQDGQPPVSWTYTDLLGQHTCSRTDPFDRAAPTYTCS